MTKKQNLTALLICIAGVALNLLLNAVVSALRLPIYLDTVGTVTAAVMGGYLPGVLVGFITCIIRSLYSPASLYYGVLNELIAVCAAYFAVRGWFKKPRGLIGAVIVLSLIGGGIGAVIPWCMEGFSFESEELSGILYNSGLFNDATAHVLSSILQDLLDKAVTVLFAAAIIKAVPESFYRYCGFSMWQQKPELKDPEKGLMTDTSKIRVMSLRNKSLLVLVISLTAIAVSGVVISMRDHHEDVIAERTEVAKSTVRLAAGMLNGDNVGEYLKVAGNTADYAREESLLKQILNSSIDIKYLYVYKMEKEGCRVIFDIDTENLEGEMIGSVVPYDRALEGKIPELLRGEEIAPVVSDDQYGYIVTAYHPVYATDGKCVCYVGADVDLNPMALAERSFLMKMTSVYFGFLILLCAFVLWLVDYHIIFPVRSITENVDAFSFNEESQSALDEKVKEIRSVDVHTGDELEVLYQSLCRLTLNQTEQMRSIRRLSDSTAKMQDGLIITMADLVESRDSDTGAHVQKTAAYVRIIVEGLRKKGYYTEKITPKFISDVVRSAPLHDVGKINIPDKVLNKPGKLTDEEYEIMKTHTTAGKRIIENAVSTIEGDNYLKEARNMAAFHHERWDGKGYPEGIHGQVIPLSARIMAVADVFDALTSPRVYKPAFSIEKALDILNEGKGTQFDPKCVEVFMDALPEVKVILRKYNKDA
ncbi:MAG: HD domain-containing protein [Lachnospiraceae bacterium]|nr:HD domain-containing protein [Lachnospiraceae bacterium]